MEPRGDGGRPGACGARRAGPGVFRLRRQVHAGNPRRILDPFHADFDDLTAVGIGYQRFLTQLPFNLRFGYEVGVAGRFGDKSRFVPGNTADFRAGAVLRYDGFSLLDAVHVAAAVTLGISAGYERQREFVKDGDASVLFYIGPEISLSPENHRKVELFGCVRHRSGGGGLLGDLNEGANAPVAGLRVFF